MSELIRCDVCEELSSYDTITYLNNYSLCSGCQEENLIEKSEYVK
jgi:formylmethanofuran dehydrogenase subunit E